jgi:TetR/AcrR family transcriptional repressor of mexJK operon
LARNTFSNNKRQNILSNATDLFLEKGFSAASTSELLRRVGGSKTTIYTHFGDKAGLFTAVVDEMVKDSVSMLGSLNLSKLSAYDALCKIAQQYLKVVLSERYIGLMRIVVAEVNRFPEIGRAFYEHGPGLSYSKFKSFLDDRVARGELDIRDTSRATDLFFGALLHRELISRLYGVKTAPLRGRTRIAVAVTNEFIERYGNLPKKRGFS